MMLNIGIVFYVVRFILSDGKVMSTFIKNKNFHVLQSKPQPPSIPIPY